MIENNYTNARERTIEAVITLINASTMVGA